MFGLSRHEWRLAFVVCLARFTRQLLSRVIPALIPVLAAVFGYPLWQLGLLVSVYFLGSGIAQAPMGVLSDRHDRARLLPAGMAVASAAYLLFAAAPLLGGFPSLELNRTYESGFLVMSAAMAIAGVAGAVVHPVGYPLISANVRAENKGKVIGIFASSSKFGDAIAPALVGVLLLVLGWEHIVGVLGLLGIAASGVIYLILRGIGVETEPSDVDRPAADATRRRDDRPYLAPLALIYALFVSRSLADIGLNTFLPAFVVGVYAYSIETAIVSFGPESVANFYFAALLISAGVAQLLLGGTTDRWDPRAVILACLVVGIGGLLILGGAELGPLGLLLVVVVLGGGIWGLNPARDVLISDISPAEREGRTFGYLWTVVYLTSSAVPVLVGYLIEIRGMRLGFMLLAIGPVVAMLAVSLLYADRFYATSPG